MDGIFEQMLSQYDISTTVSKRNATYEVMQQIALAGLYRGGFFDKAAFYGGTCLRIFHQLNRFSEDMDFSLLQSDDSFNIENYFPSIIAEFKAAGRDVMITKKEKRNQGKVESAFLKDDTHVYNLAFQTEKSIKVKIEVDTNPPLGFKTEQKLLLQPFSFMTRCMTLPGLFAGKMHALIFRTWGKRVKGRDWYDFEWYVRNNIPLDFDHFIQRTKDFNGLNLTTEDFKAMLRERLSTTDIELVKKDVAPFMKNPNELEIWSNDYFIQLANLIRFE
ncbi:nucleotidyl transferase AbiEii/AbiGii toxin family protein [uncultured Duncaniella sp.]|uniref:nucleotidyl transferase AbiEii/AbiGii toxin family protein n=1 Tax=uncultured Duncaniella sp. TaxID=2768039 RepID=UPI0025ED09C5|nr:nucleotidyl transferase AbiEii/AbiGii toxin family protein [uncultured Duncaniella sp.]